MRLKLIVFSFLSFALFSCSDKNEPINEPKKPLKVTSIKSDLSLEEYYYDSQARIITWSGSYKNSNHSKDYDTIKRVSYDYPQSLQIDLSARRRIDFSDDIYTESLFLNDSGYVEHTEGIWKRYKMIIYRYVRYIVDFSHTMKTTN